MDGRAPSGGDASHAFLLFIITFYKFYNEWNSNATRDKMSCSLFLVSPVMALFPQCPAFAPASRAPLPRPSLHPFRPYIARRGPFNLFPLLNSPLVSVQILQQKRHTTLLIH